MNNQKFDSTYGSLSGFLSSNSNSSYSMSLSDSEFPEEPPSTSGCSSDFANSSHQKEKKKERLKHYLKQLKQMVAPGLNDGSHMSTIGALKHVINSMQENKDDNRVKTEEDESQKCISICTPFSSASGSEDDVKILSLKTQDELQILVTARGLKIVQISPNLKKILGYPMDSWNGRELTNFLHRKDVVTVNSSYATDDHDRFDSHSLKFDEEGNTIPETPKKVIYCRLRHYKGLRSGYNIDKKDLYTSFHATVTLKTSAKTKDETNMDKQKQYLLLECRPLTSAYQSWSDLPVEKKTFNTRHSLFCSYTYIHPNAIPLLGFLPQDMVGMSIFDFYHPEDFEQLYNIYKQVVNSKGSTISSPKIRFRTYNGDWIYVKTEWSSFINPWSKRLEFIIGQHTVIKGPTNLDVFSPPVSQECMAEETEQYHKNLRMIRKLLLQPVVDEAKTVALNIEDEPEDVSISPVPELEKEESTDIVDGTLKKIQPVASNIRCRQLLDDNLSGTYEQLNYTNNIKRFLLSQPKTYSSASEKRSGSYTDDSNAIDSDEVPDFDVDIPLPKPPSFCSSTKVLVSEKEDMVPSPSCQTEEIVEETSRDAQTAATTLEAPNVLMCLTQETLQEHTKQQEKLYLEQAKQDSSLVLLNVSSKYSVMQESSQGLKRGHSPDMDEIQNIKSFKAEEVSLLHPPFPISSTACEVSRPGEVPPKMAFSDTYRRAPNTIYCTGGVPIVQLVPNTFKFPETTSNTVPSTGMKPDNVQWPFYPQTGLSFYPQVMGGFYQPVTVLSYPLPGVSWTNPNSTSTGQSLRQGIFTQAGNKVITTMSYSDSSSQENTSSSLIYLLELSNNSEGETSRKGIKAIQPAAAKVNQRHADPPWLFGVMWMESIQMRYVMPRRKFNRVMKEDRDALKVLKQSDVVLKQMEEFKEDLEKVNEEPTEDEEADFLFLIEPDIFKDDSSSNLGGEIESKIKFQIDDLKPLNVDTSKVSSESKLEICAGDEAVNSMVTGAQDSSSSVSDQMDYTEKKSESECDSLQKSDSSVDMESTCSKSSDLTPSEARSTDEKGSSMKESDTQLSEGNKDSESENDLNQIKNQLVYDFESFFVKNPTKFKHSKKGFWIREAEMNSKVKMEYTMNYKNRNDILLEDMNRLNEMKQSSVLQDQLSLLLDDIKKTDSDQKELCECLSSSAQNNEKCSKCSQRTNINDNFFESLFMQPLMTEEETDSVGDSSRDSPDMEDLCDIIDVVD